MRCVLQVVPSAPLAGDTDYSDPFDARLDHRPEPDLGPVPCENNGYMEPYEAQRVITGQWTRFDHHRSGLVPFLFLSPLPHLSTQIRNLIRGE